MSSERVRHELGACYIGDFVACLARQKVIGTLLKIWLRDAKNFSRKFSVSTTFQQKLPYEGASEFSREFFVPARCKFSAYTFGCPLRCGEKR